MASSNAGIFDGRLKPPSNFVLPPDLRHDCLEPRIAPIIVMASAGEIHDSVVDSLIARFLFDEGLLEQPETRPDTFSTLPGWCRRTSAAERLFVRLLPGWTFDVRSGCAHVSAQGLEHLPSACRSGFSGIGPSMARMLIAATFTALLALRVVHPVPEPA